MINSLSNEIGSRKPLARNCIYEFLKRLREGWVINKAGHLYKEFRFDNFIDAMTFANQIADMAEKEAHHPNLTITWGLCIVEIWTHDVGGLTENDFILAAKIGILK